MQHCLGLTDCESVGIQIETRWSYLSWVMWGEQLVLPGPGNVAGCMRLTRARQCYFRLVFIPEPCLETIAWNLYAWLGLSAMKGCGMPSRFCLSALRNLTQSSEEADQEFWEPFEPHLSFGRVPVGWSRAACVPLTQHVWAVSLSAHEWPCTHSKFPCQHSTQSEVLSLDSVSSNASWSLAIFAGGSSVNVW